MFRNRNLRFSSDAVHGVRYASPELKVYLPETAVRSLIAARTHTGYLEFEYFDDAPTGDFVFLYSRTERQPKDIFATVAKFKTDGTGHHGNGCGSNWPPKTCFTPRRRALR